MKRLLKIAAAAVLFAFVCVSCEKYDDTALKNSISALEKRVSDLEQMCKTLNSDISVVKNLVNGKLFIDKVVPESDGYTIFFSNGTSAKITNGKNGADGHNPIVGLRQDGKDWYWTLDGKDLLDASGNKVKANGADGAPGANGITPQLKIDSEHWFISLDEGKTWTDLGQARGAKGDDGADGHNPIVGLRQDGKDWYWTLDGKDLLDASGNKVKANGADGAPGANGITPQFKIDSEHWFLSLDEGKTWTDLGQARGAKGDAGDSMFRSAEVTGGCVVLTLVDGTVFRVPISSPITLELTVPEHPWEKYLSIAGYATFPVKVTCQGEYTLDAWGTGGVYAYYDEKTSLVYVYPEYNGDPYSDVIEEIGEFQERYKKVPEGRVFVMATTSLGQSAVKSLLFEASDIYVFSYNHVDPDGGGLDLEFCVESEADDSEYELELEDHFKNEVTFSTSAPWIHVSKPTKAYFSIYPKITVDPNFGSARVGNIFVRYKGKTVMSYPVYQDGRKPEDPVVFDDPGIQALCLYCFDKDKDGILTLSEAANVKELPDNFASLLASVDKTAIKSFDELQCFVKLTTIRPGSFEGCTSLESISCPSSLTYIWENAFNGATALENISILNPENIKTLGPNAFRGTAIKEFTIYKNMTVGSYCFTDSALEKLKIEEGIPSSNIREYAFCGTKIKEVVCPANIKSLSQGCFSQSTQLEKVTIPSTLDTIFSNVFEGCSNLSEISNLDGVELVGQKAFLNCASLKEIVLPSVQTIYSFAFQNCTSLEYVELGESLTSVASSAFGDDKAIKKVRCAAKTPPDISTSLTFPKTLPLLEVPAGSKAAYEASGWAQFFSEIKEF